MSELWRLNADANLMRIRRQSACLFLFALVDIQRHGQELKRVMVSEPTRHIALIAVWLAMVKAEQIVACIHDDLNKIRDNFIRFLFAHAVLLCHGLSKTGFDLRNIFLCACFLCKVTADNICLAHSISTILMQELNNLALENQIPECRLHKFVNRFVTRFTNHAISKVVTVRCASRTNRAIANTQQRHIVHIGVELLKLLDIALR